jgi:hypothetical protein
MTSSPVKSFLQPRLPLRAGSGDILTALHTWVGILCSGGDCGCHQSVHCDLLCPGQQMKHLPRFSHLNLTKSFDVGIIVLCSHFTHGKVRCQEIKEVASRHRAAELVLKPRQSYFNTLTSQH